MKKIFTIIGAVLLFGLGNVSAQSFHLAKDTMNVSLTGTNANLTVVDTFYNTASTSQSIQWKITSTNFTPFMQSVTSFCDAFICYPWPGGTNTCTYNPGVGDFHMLIKDTTAMPIGCYYVRVKFNNSAITPETDSTTFIVCKSPAGITTVKSQEDIVLYPNPANNELNVVYNASADIKNIAVYNIIGKAMAVYRVTDNNSANLNLENMPAGIYFVRLMNSHGEVVVTRKFTKQ